MDTVYTDAVLSLFCLPGGTYYSQLKSQLVIPDLEPSLPNAGFRFEKPLKLGFESGSGLGRWQPYTSKTHQLKGIIVSDVMGF